MGDNNEKKGSEKFASFLSKASDMGKKAAAGIERGVSNFSEQTKKNIEERRFKKLSPVFPEDYASENFHIPNVIRIVDDADRRDIESCKGAIGWLEKESKVEILCLYDEWVDQSGLEFYPPPICNEMYLKDRFNPNKYIGFDRVFEISHSERLAELEHIAHSLGAKSCSVELVEGASEHQEVHFGEKESVTIKGVTVGQGASRSTYNGKSQSRSGRTISYFEGSDNPVAPTLKWFAQDDHIKRLIEMRCNQGNAIQSRSLTLEGSSSATMSQTAACNIDIAVKSMGYRAAASFEKKAQKEFNSKLIFDIEF